jgi:hypothetical protein
MKIVKRILWAFAVVIGIPLIVAFFVKKEYTVVRTISIDESNQNVFNYIKFLKNQDTFSKWANIDPSMEKSYKGTDGTVGFVAGWHSLNDEVGTGEQEILKIEEGKRVDFELRFKEPFESVSSAYMSTNPISRKVTKVTWGFIGVMVYPTNLMLLFMDFEKMIGDDLSEGLNNLKQELEK